MMMSNLPAWFDKQLQEQNRRSKEQEIKRARQTGGKRQPGSGSSYRAPQDNRRDDALEQIKYTDKGSFTIKVAEWTKLRKEAIQHGREPCMVVEFMDKHDRVTHLRLIIMEEDA